MAIVFYAYLRRVRKVQQAGNEGWEREIRTLLRSRLLSFGHGLGLGRHPWVPVCDVWEIAKLNLVGSKMNVWWKLQERQFAESFSVIHTIVGVEGQSRVTK